MLFIVGLQVETPSEHSVSKTLAPKASDDGSLSCSTVCANLGSQPMATFQVFQRNAASFVCSEYRRRPGISVTALLQQLQWPSLADRRLIARLTLFYIAHTGKINIPLCNIMDRSDSRTRGAKNNYKLISTKTTAFGQSFFPKTLKEWNKLDNETKESSTTNHSTV